MAGDSDAENEAQSAALVFFVLFLSMLGLVTLVVSIRCSIATMKKYYYKNSSHANDKCKAATQVFSASTIALFTLTNMSTLTLYTSVWVHGRCKVAYNRICTRATFYSYTWGYQSMCVCMCLFVSFVFCVFCVFCVCDLKRPYARYTIL